MKSRVRLQALAVKGKFKTIIKALGLNPDLSVHSLRHTAAIMMLRAGVAPATIQAHLRQRTGDAVMKYLRLFGEAADSERDRLAGILSEWTKR